MYVCIHAWIIVYTPHIRLYIHLYIVFTPRKLTRATTFKADQKTKTATGKHRAPRKSEKLRPRRFVRERVFYNNAHTGAFQLTHPLPPFFITARFLQQRLFFTTTPTPVQCLPTPSTLTCHPSPSPPTPLNSKASTLIPNAGIWQRSRTLLYPQLSPYLPTATVPYFINGIGHGTLLSPQPSVLSLSLSRARAISFCRSLCPSILTPVHTFVVFAKRRQIRV
jgi:hypothetical protein